MATAISKNTPLTTNSSMEIIHLTRAGAEKLRSELERLVKVARPAATIDLATAREHGDLSENAEYDAARDNLATIDLNIITLQQKLGFVQIIEGGQFSNDEVHILSKVTLLDTKRNREVDYTLVDPEQSDPTRRLISVKSPIGQGLLRKKVGEEVTITIPAGEITLKVLAIETAEGV
ncbi:MAG: transcription elongation factor GreA [Candidatus Electryoneaceae bacterium]|nr:transcription elongation factor GreA [Candidatus Electryoneaceae bacterium]